MPEPLLTGPVLGIAGGAILAGAVGAMMGVGGGIILVPLLMLAFHASPDHARAASLVAMCVTSTGGSLVYLREGATDLVAAAKLQLPTAAGALVGALFGTMLNDDAVRILFAVFLVVVAVSLVLPKREHKNVTGNRWLASILACFCGGIISATLGVGGGLVFVPVLTLLLGREPRVAAATSTFLIGLTGAASGLIYASQLDQVGERGALVSLALPSAFGIFIGAQIGARVSRFLSGPVLRYCFAAIMLTNSTLLVWRVVSG